MQVDRNGTHYNSQYLGYNGQVNTNMSMMMNGGNGVQDATTNSNSMSTMSYQHQMHQPPQ